MAGLQRCAHVNAPDGAGGAGVLGHRDAKLITPRLAPAQRSRTRPQHQHAPTPTPGARRAHHRARSSKLAARNPGHTSACVKPEEVQGSANPSAAALSPTG